MTASPLTLTRCRLVLGGSHSGIGWCANCRETNSCCMTALPPFIVFGCERSDYRTGHAQHAMWWWAHGVGFAMT
jgi:hypothetical protein